MSNTTLTVGEVRTRIIDLLNLHDDQKFIITEKSIFIDRFLASLSHSKNLAGFTDNLILGAGVFLSKRHKIREIKLWFTFLIQEDNLESILKDYFDLTDIEENKSRLIRLRNSLFS